MLEWKNKTFPISTSGFNIHVETGNVIDVLAGCFFGQFPQFGGIAVIVKTPCPADLSRRPVFSIAVFCRWVVCKKNARVGSSFRVDHDQGTQPAWHT
jgi:hypothetical protein